MNHALNPRHSTRLAMKFSCRAQPAKLQNRLTARLITRQTALLVPLSQEIDVGGELFVEVQIQFAAAKHGSGPRFSPVVGTHCSTGCLGSEPQ
jgi:hypothetical protein